MPSDDDLIPMDASHASDIERIDKALDDLGEKLDDPNFQFNWKSAEFIFDALGDARTSIISLAEKLNEERSKQ